MNMNLSFEQGPPISVPYRFFLTAPLFGIVAGLLAATAGADAFDSRWTPEMLAIAHALAVGLVLQTVAGALLQIIPVAAGANVWRPRLVANILHPLLTASALVLVLGLEFSRPCLLRLAGPLFVIAVGGLVAVVAPPLWRTSARGMCIVALRLAVASLAAATAFGAWLASALGWGFALPLATIADIHAAWGLAGWALTLIAGVAYLVIPMFQLTPQYPPTLSRALPWGLFGFCILWSMGLIESEAEAAWRQYGVAAAAMLLAAWFAATTLQLLQRRRRKVSDITCLFWRVGMAALLVVALSRVLAWAIPALGEHSHAPLWFGVLMFIGVLLSLINGMLYKILPFLNWLHLQGKNDASKALPNMKQMISERSMYGQLGMHCAALVMLLIAVWQPALVRWGGLALSASCAWLEWNLVSGVAVYRRHRATDRIPAVAACHES